MQRVAAMRSSFGEDGRVGVVGGDYRVALHCIALHCIALHCIASFQCIALQYITVQYITLHYLVEVRVALARRAVERVGEPLRPARDTHARCDV